MKLSAPTKWQSLLYFLLKVHNHARCHRYVKKVDYTIIALSNQNTPLGQILYDATSEKFICSC